MKKLFALASVVVAVSGCHEQSPNARVVERATQYRDNFLLHCDWPESRILARGKFESATKVASGWRIRFTTTDPMGDTAWQPRAKLYFMEVEETSGGEAGQVSYGCEYKQLGVPKTAE
jgi:hypothetical protein